MAINTCIVVHRIDLFKVKVLNIKSFFFLNRFFFLSKKDNVQHNVSFVQYLQQLSIIFSKKIKKKKKEVLKK